MTSSNNNRQAPPLGTSSELRNNAFQWKNMYFHRYGVCTYPPPLPRDPSTTTQEYPNVDAFHAMRDASSSGSSGAARGSVMGVMNAFRSRLQSRAGSIGGRSDSVGDAEMIDGADEGPSRNHLLNRTSILMQRKAQLLLRKKKEMEEMRKQNPFGLEASVLAIHQQAWTLLLDDSVLKTTSIDAREYAESARSIKARLMIQMRRSSPVQPEAPFSLAIDTATDPLPFGTGDHAVPSGATYPLHEAIAVERDKRARLLAEFAPFFAVISTPSTVSQLHAAVSSKPGQYTVPTSGGSGDSVGLPIFSQFATWEEACTRRRAWPLTPFHFFLTRDSSFNYGHIAAIFVMVDAINTYMHRHNAVDPFAPPPEKFAGASPKAEKTSSPTNRLKKKVAETFLSVPGRKGIDQTPRPPVVPNPVPSAPVTRLWDGKTRYGCGKCSSVANPNPCPTIAIENIAEDVILVYEHANVRSTLPMLMSVLRLLLDKSMKPSLSMQLFGKKALLDIYLADSSRDDDEEDSGGLSLLARLLDPQRQAAVASSTTPSNHNNNNKTLPQDLNDTTAAASVLDDLEDSTNDDAYVPVFSEREFHALFTLGQWFLDSPTALSTGLVTRAEQRLKRRLSQASDGYKRIQSVARAATLSIAEAVVRYMDARQQRRLNALKTITEQHAAYHELIRQLKQDREERDLFQRQANHDMPAHQQQQEHGDKGGNTSLHNNNAKLHAPRAPLPGGDRIGDVLTSEKEDRHDWSVAHPPSDYPASQAAGNLLRSETPLELPAPPPDIASFVKETADGEFPTYVTRLATPLIVLSAYMRLHGTAWVTALMAGVLEYLKDPNVMLYVTDDQLPAPPKGQPTTTPRAFAQAKPTPPADRESAFDNNDNSFALPEGTGNKNRPSRGFNSTPRSSATNPFEGGAGFSNDRSPQLSGVLSPNNVQLPSIRMETSMTLDWTFPTEKESAPGFGFSGGMVASLSPRTSEGALKTAALMSSDKLPLLPSPSVEAIVKPSPVGAPNKPSPSSSAAQQQQALNDDMMAFLCFMEKKEENISVHVCRSLELFFRLLERSHGQQKMPSGISYLITTFCATIHCHLLSGIVMSSTLNAAESIAPDTVDMVDYYMKTLIGGANSSNDPQYQASLSTGKKDVSSSEQSSSRPVAASATVNGSPTTPAPSAAATRRKQTVTMFADGDLTEPREDSRISSSAPTTATATPNTNAASNMFVSARPPPSPSVSSILGASAATIVPGPSISNMTPPTAVSSAGTSSAATGAGGGSSTGGKQQGNATGNISLVTDIQTFRLAKFLLFDVWLLPLLSNAQRYGILPPHATQHQLNNLNALVRYIKIVVNAPYLQREEERKGQTKQQQQQQRTAPVVGSQGEASGADSVKKCYVPPFISGVYNASNGSLIQLYRRPEVLLAAAAAAEEDSAKNSAASSPRSSPERRNSSRRRSSASTSSIKGGRLPAATPGGGSNRLLDSGGSGSNNNNTATRRASRATPRKSVFAAGSGFGGGGGNIVNNPMKDYYLVQHEQACPKYGELSHSLQNLNAALGLSTAVVTTSGLFTQNAANSQSHHHEDKTVSQLLDVFCWHTATDDDRNRVVAEFHVPDDVAARCLESVYRVVVGLHPSTKIVAKTSQSNTMSATDGPQPQTSVPVKRPSDSGSVTPRNDQQRASILSIVSASVSVFNDITGRGPTKPPEETAHAECVELYTRCLHSVLLHPSIAGAALDNLSVNHRKLFHQLVKHQETPDEATAVACNLYPFLIVGVKDQPLVDINAVSILTASSPNPLKDAPLPSTFLQARRRLLSRQLFLATGSRLPDLDTQSPSASPSAASMGLVSPRKKNSLVASQQRRRQAEAAARLDPEDIPQNYFAPWWCYMAAALTAKAESVLDESNPLTSIRWEKRCRATVRRFLRRDSTPDVSSTFAQDGERRRAKPVVTLSVDESHKGNASATVAKGFAKRRAQNTTDSGKVTSASLPPPSVMGPRPPTVGLLVPGNTGRRASSSASTRSNPKLANPLMERWRDAVTNLLRERDESLEQSSSVTTTPRLR